MAEDEDDKMFFSSVFSLLSILADRAVYFACVNFFLLSF